MALGLDADAKSNYKDSSVFKLPSVMTIETAEALASELKQLSLSECNSLTLDASNVENITTTGLQLIISLEKNISSSGGLFTIKGGGESFVCAFRDAGLENLLSGRAK